MRQHQPVAGSGLPGAGPGGAPLLENSGIPQDEMNTRPRTPVGEAKLPGDGQGGADKGLSLDKGIPGTSTFNKPESDIRDFDKGTNTDPWRRDSPDDQLKDRERVDTKEDWAEPHDGIGEMGKGKSDPADYSKTKWPYRDDPGGHPNYASFHVNPREQAEYIANLYLLRFAHEALLRPKPPGVRIAAKNEEITQGLDPAWEARGRGCQVQIRRVDAPNLRWLFAVDCGNGGKVVRLKAQRVGNVVRLAKMHLRVSCSCKAWRWLGPEYHAKKEKYLDGKPVGTASSPDIKDPERTHLVCKHVSAVLGFIKKWEVPLPKPEAGEAGK